MKKRELGLMVAAAALSGVLASWMMAPGTTSAQEGDKPVGSEEPVAEAKKPSKAVASAENADGAEGKEEGVAEEAVQGEVKLTAEALRARSVEIVDMDGTVVIKMATGEDGYGIWVHDGFKGLKPLKIGKRASDADVKKIEALSNHIETLNALEEQDVTDITLQHILISFEGAANSTQTRSKREAELLAAQLYEQIVNAEEDVDFKSLMDEHSNDPGAGEYSLTTGAAKPGVYHRQRMVPAFGNVGYRLQVGEVGVAPHDDRDSPFGWHIIKRIK